MSKANPPLPNLQHSKMKRGKKKTTGRRIKMGGGKMSKGGY